MEGVGQTPRHVRACISWKNLMSKVLEVIKKFQEESMQEARRAAGMGRALHATGLPSGSLPVAGSAQRVPPLPLFQGHMNKQDELEAQRLDGLPLPPRRCKMPARLPACACIHPKESLVSAGNQYQREVWCQECHSRWKVATMPAPLSLRSMPASSMSQPPTTPSTQRGTLSPASTITQEVELKCKCNLPAVRLRVKKDGPTKGRHFFKCPRYLCDYFAWDPIETKQMEKREPEVSPEVSKMMEEVTLAKKELMIREESLREREDSVMVMQHSCTRVLGIWWGRWWNRRSRGTRKLWRTNNSSTEVSSSRCTTN